MRQVGGGMATLIRADWDRMVEAFQGVIGVLWKWLFDQFNSPASQRRNNLPIMRGRPGLVGVNNQARSRRRSPDRFYSWKIEAVAAQFQLEKRNCVIRARGCRHFLGRVQTDCKRGFNGIEDLNVRQVPHALAGSLRFQVPERAVQGIAGGP